MGKSGSTKASALTCPHCGQELHDHLRYCPACQTDIGFPNVRAAERQDEVAALDRRYQDAMTSAQTRNCEDVVNQFRQAVSSSQAVLCSPISSVQEFVSSDNKLHAIFHQLVQALNRLPEKNKWDPGRQGREATVFPYYYDQIQYAALSLDGTGVTGYGGCAMALKETMISERATVFEENNALFILRKKIIAGEPIPFGYRTTWSNRDRLAVAKLADKIESDTDPDEFAAILMESTRKTDCDFIEVHIYGTIHRRAIERITMKEPKHRADKAIMASIKKKLHEIGVQVEFRK